MSFQTAAKENNAKANNCIDCHSAQTNQWQASDHANAMALPTEHTVLGNFNEQTVSHFSQQARFYKKQNNFWAELKHGPNTQHYQIAYTFGHYPLQQYLIKADDGKYQVFPFSWDSRAKTEGGQRWYPIYADEDIKANDRLHWLQPLQSWNGMCADCHSDGLKRNYDTNTGHFSTTFDNINVGCQSCHGEVVNQKNHGKTNSPKDIKPTYTNQWLIKAGQATATWQGKERNNDFMDTCFACHALRSPLTDGLAANSNFLDQFSPSFLQPNLYHADGQIKEEVYVYGSFLQSKMFKAGVNCLDCHDKHSMKIKVQGNGLCLQCHNPEVFEQKSHHQHSKNSEGSQCVNCHMPETRYMGVDDRRDHSFKIPRPHLSNQFETPNACLKCHEHQDKSNDWAAKKVEQWHGKPAKLSHSEKSYLALQQNTPIALEQHLALINDPEQNAIFRATAITLLPNSTAMLNDITVKAWVNHQEPLIRLAIARMGNLLSASERAKSYASLLSDNYKAIRTAAANHLINVPNIDKALLNKAFKELLTANDNSSWRGEGNLNQSMAHIANGHTEKAMRSLQHGIKVDPYFEANYINLADLYRNLGKTAEEKNTYLAALTALPNSALAHYSYGLHLIRAKQKTAAVTSFAKAMKLAPNNSQYTYLYLLALDSVGKTKQALYSLTMQLSKYQHNPQMLQLGLSFAQKLNDRKSYALFYQQLQQRQ